MVDELKQKLIYTTIELESVKIETYEELRKNKEYLMNLLHLLTIACQERNEARESRDQLQKLLNNVLPSTPTELLPALPPLQPQTPLTKPIKSNSTITESNSLSDTYTDSLFDTISSPDIPNISLSSSSNNAFVVNQNQPIFQDYNGCISLGSMPTGVPKTDRASFVIENLVKGKTLPQKGKLLEAVVDAGPLLHTLLVAGPLPQWRIPPPINQPIKIPPVPIKACEAAAVINLNSAANLSNVVPRPLNSLPYVEMSCGSSQMLNFSSSPSSSNGQLLPSSMNISCQLPLAKRQRLQ